jgi:spore maturation protein CgeB
MVTFYEKKPEACLKIARAAFERAKKEHTWAHRFKKVFKTLGFDV